METGGVRFSIINPANKTWNKILNRLKVLSHVIDLIFYELLKIFDHVFDHVIYIGTNVTFPPITLGSGEEWAFWGCSLMLTSKSTTAKSILNKHFEDNNC